jgi:L-lactate dehydrogenase (cytochrome)/(S)-mandelate dehydrogenase
MDFVEGGAGDERAIAEALKGLRQICLLPRPLSLSTAPTLQCSLFGRRYAAPFGIAPMGLADLVWPGADRGLAETAVRENIPYIAPTASSLTLEEIVERHCPNAWFQLYPGPDIQFTQGMLARASSLGVEVLVLTVDAPVPGRRLRDLRNQFAIPFKLGAHNFLSCLGRPKWLAATVRRGGPKFGNFSGAHAGTRLPAATWMASQSRPFDWDSVERVRRAWKGKLILKGILHPADAVRALTAGTDGIIVSSHGGRQLEASPAPIDVLPAIRGAVESKLPVLVDGGIRSGEDIAKALVAGADFVLLGRAFLFGVAAMGPVDGPRTVMDLLKIELATAFSLLGISTPAGASSDYWYQPSQRNQFQIETSDATSLR